MGIISDIKNVKETEKEHGFSLTKIQVLKHALAICAKRNQFVLFSIDFDRDQRGTHFEHMQSRGASAVARGDTTTCCTRVRVLVAGS